MIAASNSRASRHSVFAWRTLARTSSITSALKIVRIKYAPIGMPQRYGHHHQPRSAWSWLTPQIITPAKMATMAEATSVVDRKYRIHPSDRMVTRYSGATLPRQRTHAELPRGATTSNPRTP